MSSKGSHRIAVAKHVYLRTQQRRLRHVKSVVIRNLSLPVSQELVSASLNISVYFTLHPLYNEDKILYRSEPVCQSYNPAWESVQFTSSVFGKHSSLSIFTIKVWFQRMTCSHLPSPPSQLTPGQLGGADAEEEVKKNFMLAFEGIIDFPDLVYIGAVVNKDGSGYPSNSVVIGMFEGYYSNPGVGGTQAPPPISHSLVDLLPPRSLLEVSRTEVLDSYLNHTLRRILLRQEVLNKKTMEANQCKARVQAYLKEQEVHFNKKRERERLRMKVTLLQRQLQEQEKLEKEKSEGLRERDVKLNSWEEELRMKQEVLVQKETQYQLDRDTYHKNKEMLVHKHKSRTLRQRNMIYELSQTFFINEVMENSFTICKVILPNSDQLDQTSSIEQCGVALGYAAHLVSQLGHVLQVPLQYPIKPCGSRSTISDHISEEVIIDTIKEFPLYLKGTEKALFQYAVHLLNKDIGQLRQHCGYGGSRGMLKKTLPSLKSLLDNLVKDYFLSSHSPFNIPADRSRNTSEPMDAISSRTLLDRERLLGEKRLSSPSSHNYNRETNITLGLSPTSPNPHTVSPRASLDHESFHSIATSSIPLSTSLLTSGHSIDEGSGVVSNAGSDDRSSSNSGPNMTMEVGFQGGLFRSHSNHVVSSFQHPSSETLTASLGSSTHEQLHHPIPTTPTSSTPSDEQWRRRGGPHHDSISSRTDAFPSLKTTGREKNEISGIEGGLPEFENGGHSSVLVEPPQTSTELTRNTFFQESKVEKHVLVQELISNPLEQEPVNSEWELEQNDIYKCGNSNLSSQKECLKGGLSGSQGDVKTTMSDDTDHTLLTKDYDENQVEMVRGDNSYSHGSGGDDSADLVDGHVQLSEEYLVAGFDQTGESSLDLINSNRVRCSPLVGSKELHNRRVLAETKEHNFLPPPSSSSTGTHSSIMFMASGFSRLSPDNVSMMTYTLPKCIQGAHKIRDKQTLDLNDVREAHMISDRSTIEWNEGARGHKVKVNEDKGHSIKDNKGNSHSTKDNGGKGSNSQSDSIRGQSTQDTYLHDRLPSSSINTSSTSILIDNEVAGDGDRSKYSSAIHIEQAASQRQQSSVQLSSVSQVIDDQVELSNLAMSSSSRPHSQFTGIPRSQASNHFRRHDPSSMVHGSLPSWTTSPGSPPPLACPQATNNYKDRPSSIIAPSARLIMPPQVSVFQHPPGYLLKHVGVSTPHVVGRGEEEGERMSASTLVTEGSGSSTGHTHQGMGNTGRDTQFLEDFIDGF